jgi:hypothetical protein
MRILIACVLACLFASDARGQERLSSDWSTQVCADALEAGKPYELQWDPVQAQQTIDGKLWILDRHLIEQSVQIAGATETTTTTTQIGNDARFPFTPSGVGTRYCFRVQVSGISGGVAPPVIPRTPPNFKLSAPVVKPPMALYDVATLGSAVEFEFSDATGPAIARVDSTHFITAHTTGIAGNFEVTVHEVNWATGAITQVGTPYTEFVTLGSTSHKSNRIVRLSSTLFVASYAVAPTGAAPYEVRVATFEIDGSYNVSLKGSAITVITGIAGGNTPHDLLALSDNTKVLVTWQDASSDGWIDVLTVNHSTGAITGSGSPLEYNTTQGGMASLSMLSSTLILVSYQGSGNDGYAQTLTLNTTNWTVGYFGSALEYDITQHTNGRVLVLSSSSVLILWSGPGGDGFAQVFSVNTGTGAITAVGSAFEFDALDATSISAALIDSTHAWVIWSGVGSDGFTQVLEFNAGTGAISALGSAIEFDTANLNGSDLEYDAATGRGIVFYGGVGGDGYLQAFTIEIPAGSNSASLSATLGAVTLTAQSSPAINATLAATLGAATLSASGGEAEGNSATLSATLGSASVTSQASPQVTSDLLATLGSVSLSAQASPRDTADLISTLGSASLSAQASPTSPATLSLSLEGVNFASEASPRAAASVSAALANAVLSASGGAGAGASLNATLSAAVLSAEASPRATGAALVQLDAAGLDADAVPAVLAALQATLSAASLTATAVPEIRATANLALSAAVLSAQAGESEGANLSATLSPATLAAQAVPMANAAIAVSLGAAQLAAQGIPEVRASVLQTLGAAGLTSEAIPAALAAMSATLEASTLSGAASPLAVASLAAVLADAFRDQMDWSAAPAVRTVVSALIRYGKLAEASRRSALDARDRTTDVDRLLFGSVTLAPARRTVTG